MRSDIESAMVTVTETWQKITNPKDLCVCKNPAIFRLTTKIPGLPHKVNGYCEFCRPLVYFG